MTTLLEIAGALLVLLALMHLGLPRYFGWREESRHLSLFTAQVLRVHTFFIGLTVGLMGLLALSSAELLAGTPLGRRVSAGIAFFWICRLLIQFFGYSPELWRGKRFETAMHVLFSLLWAYLSLAFTLAALG